MKLPSGKLIDLSAITAMYGDPDTGTITVEFDRDWASLELRRKTSAKFSGADAEKIWRVWNRDSWNCLEYTRRQRSRQSGRKPSLTQMTGKF